VHFLLTALFLSCGVAGAQELPYFVTYSHHLEEPGNLEIENKTAIAHPQDGNAFLGSAIEFEYGVAGWWTSELYLDGQTAAKEATTFTGFRLENRFRPLLREHWINPVLYAELEDTNGADKSLLEVVGHDGTSDLAAPVHESSPEKQREAELKLILSSDVHAWNLSENLIFEKNLSNQPWEFGYALAASHPLALHGVPRPGSFAPQNFIAGVEMYGGLGDRHAAGLHDTSHYLGPTLSYALPHGVSAMFSPSFGLNGNSLDHIFRLGLNYEIGQLFARER